MAFSGGTFSRLYDWTTDRDNGVKILASRMDQEFDGMATGLSTCILKDGTQTCTAAIPFAQGITLPDNKTIILGTNSDITIQYDESTNDSLEIAANVEGAALGIVLKADQGDDNADQHKVGIADGGTLTMASKISGSFVSYLTHTPNSTVASSTTAVAGNLTVGGDLTLGSGAVISEAELETIDGITPGTAAASKAMVLDASLDISGGRNLTISGELDAATLDVSGDVDIDGTLETDALSIASTAVTATAAELNYSDTGAAVGTVVASKVVTADANKDVASFRNITLTGELDAGSLDISGNADIDGTLEADAMTLNGTAITTTATLDTGISNNNVPKFTSGVADDDFLRVDGTAIEGRSAAEVLSDIGGQASLTFGISNTNAVKIDSASVADDEYARFTASGLESRATSEVLSDIAAAPAAGSSNIVTTGALNSGSITSGFGSIDNGSSNITTTGVGTFASLDISGDIDVDGTTNLDVVDIDGAVDMASTLQVDGAITSSAGATITTSDNSSNLTLTSTDADANSGPQLDFYRNSASPADNDILGALLYTGKSSTGSDKTYSSMNGFISNVANANASGGLIFSTRNSDTLAERLRITSAGFVGIGVSSPTLDGSLAGLSVNSSGTLLQVNNGDGASLKLTDPATGANRGLGITLQGVEAAISNCESGSLRFGTGNTERLRVDGSGNVLAGTTTSNYSATNGFGVIAPAAATYAFVSHPNGTSNSTDYIAFSYNGSRIGNITQASTSSVAYNTSSDYRLKTAVTYDWDATTRLKQLKPARFEWIADGDDAVPVDGFLAHEVQSIVPEAITGTKDAMKDENYVVTEAKGDIYTPETDDADEVIHSSNVERPMSLANGQAWRETAPQVTGTRNVPEYQQIDQSKIVPLLVKTILELEARIAVLEA